MAATSMKRRPRNRRSQIADHAAALFASIGYHRVTIYDVAAAVGVTGRAVYRHFENKQALLAHAVLDRLAALELAADGDDPITAIAATSLRLRDAGVLIDREARHLPSAAAEDVERRRAAVAQRLHPAASTGRAVLAVLLSPSHHSMTVDDDVALLASMAASVAPAAPHRRVPTTANGEAPSPPRASRREALLSAAIDLFAERGYDDTRMQDIGNAAGIAGPSVYEHFESKADLLAAALRRGSEWLQLGLTDALARETASADALRAVVSSYSDFVGAHPALMAVLLRETVNLPDDDRHAIRQLQHAYVAEWVRLVHNARPGLGSAESWFITHGALAVLNDSPWSHADVDLALAVLTNGGASCSEP